jgi:hypothetical protein
MAWWGWDDGAEYEDDYRARVDREEREVERKIDEYLLENPLAHDQKEARRDATKQGVPGQELGESVRERADRI